MLSKDHCTALTFRFLAESWWKIHSHIFEFLSVVFARFHVHLYIPWVLLYGSVWSLKGSSHICISVKLDLFHCLASDRKSPPQRKETLLIIFSKEVDLARNLFHKQRIYHQKSINIQQSFHLGCCATLYIAKGSLTNKKEDFKYRDRRHSFSVSLNFYQTILQSSLQTRFMFDIKKLL